MDSGPVKREIVIPGDLLGGKDTKPGFGAFIEGENVYCSLLGIKTERYGRIGVIRLGGRYMPSSGDLVIGVVKDRGPTHWLVDINAPYPASLHPAETPWQIDFGDTGRFLEVGDTILANVLSVDVTKRIQLTMQERDSRRMTGGQLVEMSPSKVPRLIGKRGSMIAMLKDYTGCRMLVGQNGRLWVDGNPRDMLIASRAVELIEERSQIIGLTESVREFLESEYGDKERRWIR